MIVDTLARAHTYSGLGPRFVRAFEYLRLLDVASLTPGTYEIDGRTVYAVVQTYTTKSAAGGKWEAHRRYADVQFVVSGLERIGYAPLLRMRSGGYDPERDYEEMLGDGEFLTLRAGEFMVLWPGEAHMPGIAADGPAEVLKIVVKVQAE